MKKEINKSKIGFIGLGIMGKPMAKNLIKAGYSLFVHNRSQAPVDELVREGAQPAKSPNTVAQHSEIVITMLPNSPDVETVVLGENGILAGVKAETIIIDMSSIEPLVSQRIAAEAAKKGVEFLDAPVSGGEPGAIQGTLAIMVGGKEEIFKRCLPIFEVLGKRAVRVGDVGAGGFAKLANQIIVALNIAALSEAFVLGQKAGLDPEKLFQAIRGGLAGSHVMDAKAPLIMDRNFKPGFKIKLHNKDIKNALATAAGLQVPLPLTGLIEQILAALLVDGKGELDHSAIIQFAEKLAQIEVRKEG
ncbi:MAG: 2-hydroxy-3-oxopropionate reductase [bacterium]|nr:MAG: 2-hydroxy-3-oxopropionate reductase [bacterium]